MALTPAEIKDFSGLHLQANSLVVPDGAMEEALNCVIRNDGIVSRRRGFYEVFDPQTVIANRLINFDENLVMISESDGAFHFTETGTAPNKTLVDVDNNGVAFTATNRRVNFTQANKNTYFTSNEGVMKLESYDGEVKQSGIPPALDIRGTFLAENGPIGLGQMAYRLLFALRDSNDNLLLGSPGDSLVLTNFGVDGSSYTNPSANIVRVTTSAPHNLTTGMAVFITTATDGGINGLYTVTVISNVIYEFNKGSAVTVGNLDYFVSRSSRLEFSVPQEITDASAGYFYRLYRSSNSGDENISPFGDYRLVVEKKLTSTEISTGVAFYEDNLLTDDLLGEELYTNENSQEGELQANDRAPIALDVTTYKGYVAYGNVRTRHTIAFNVIDPLVIVAAQYVEVKVGGVTRRYVFRGGVGNSTVSATGAGTGTITVTYTAHGMINGDQIRISKITGTAPEGLYAIAGVTANTFTFSSPGNTATALDFQGVRNAALDGIVAFDKANASKSVRIRSTALFLVKAINRDATSEVYARYTSAIDDVPGKIRLTSAGFGDPIELRASNDATGSLFEPVFTTAFADTVSDNDELPHVVYFSKSFRPEGVPSTNYFEIGARNKAILRVEALQDSLIILKQDGVFRITGDSISSFTVAPVDTTIEIINGAIADKLQNQIVTMSNQGIVAISESSVELISRKIEDVIQPILGLIETTSVGCAFGSESDRLLIVSTIAPGQNELTVTWVYNILNQTWTQWDTLIIDGVVGPFDTIYMITKDGLLTKERKNFTKIDYCDQNFDITVDSVDSDLMGANITSVVAFPEAGDIIVKNSTITRIRSVTDLTGNQYRLIFGNSTNIEAADTPILYDGFLARVVMSPFHGGVKSALKQFSECHVHFRTHGITKATLDFRGQYYNSAGEFDWLDNKVLDGKSSAGGGWGLDPWGQFPWGNVDSDLLQYGTQSILAIRMLVPILAARNPFIQLKFEHKEAAEPLEIQAITWLVRTYGTRFSR